MKKYLTILQTLLLMSMATTAFAGQRTYHRELCNTTINCYSKPFDFTSNNHVIHTMYQNQLATYNGINNQVSVTINLPTVVNKLNPGLGTMLFNDISLNISAILSLAGDNSIDIIQYNTLTLSYTLPLY